MCLAADLKIILADYLTLHMFITQRCTCADISITGDPGFAVVPNTVVRGLIENWKARNGVCPNVFQVSVQARC